MKNMERKKKEQLYGSTVREGSFSIPRYNLQLSTCIPNMKFLSGIILEISLTKNYSTECMARKKSEHIQGRTNRRRPVLYPTIQLVIVNLHTKYERVGRKTLRNLLN